MNANQRRKFIRSDKQQQTKKFNLVMGNCERYLMKTCIMCAAALSLPTLLANNTTYACPEEHWKQWLTTIGEKTFAVLLEESEGTPGWLVQDISKEKHRRAEEFLVNVRNKGE